MAPTRPQVAGPKRPRDEIDGIFSEASLIYRQAGVRPRYQPCSKQAWPKRFDDFSNAQRPVDVMRETHVWKANPSREHRFDKNGHLVPRFPLQPRVGPILGLTGLAHYDEDEHEHVRKMRCRRVKKGPMTIAKYLDVQVPETWSTKKGYTGQKEAVVLPSKKIVLVDMDALEAARASGLRSAREGQRPWPSKPDTAEARRAEARRAETRREEARRVEARLEEARRAEARRVEARLEEARLAEARLEEARLEEARRAEARLEEARLAEVEASPADSRPVESRLDLSLAEARREHRRANSPLVPSRRLGMQNDTARQAGTSATSTLTTRPATDAAVVFEDVLGHDARNSMATFEMRVRDATRAWKRLSRALEMLEVEGKLGTVGDATFGRDLLAKALADVESATAALSKTRHAMRAKAAAYTSASSRPSPTSDKVAVSAKLEHASELARRAKEAETAMLELEKLKRAVEVQWKTVPQTSASAIPGTSRSPQGLTPEVGRGLEKLTEALKTARARSKTFGNISGASTAPEIVPKVPEAANKPQLKMQEPTKVKPVSTENMTLEVQQIPQWRDQTTTRNTSLGGSNDAELTATRKRKRTRRTGERDGDFVFDDDTDSEDDVLSEDDIARNARLRWSTDAGLSFTGKSKKSRKTRKTGERDGKFIFNPEDMLSDDDDDVDGPRNPRPRWSNDAGLSVMVKSKKPAAARKSREMGEANSDDDFVFNDDINPEDDMMSDGDVTSDDENKKGNPPATIPTATVPENISLDGPRSPRWLDQMMKTGHAHSQRSNDAGPSATNESQNPAETKKKTKRTRNRLDDDDDFIFVHPHPEDEMMSEGEVSEDDTGTKKADPTTSTPVNPAATLTPKTPSTAPAPKSRTKITQNKGK